MKKSFYLPLMVVVLIGLTVWTVYGQEQRNTGKEIWEYKSIALYRSALDNAEFSEWYERSGPTVKQLPLPISMPAKANDLGEQGWELISVTPISSRSCSDCAGFTSQISYWFKRPK